MTKVKQPKRVVFGKQYRVKKQIDMCKQIVEMYTWCEVCKKTEDRKIWEAYMPKDHSIPVDTIVVFTDWVLNQEARERFAHMEGEPPVLFHHESELVKEDFVRFQIVGSDVVYATNLKDFDELELVE